MSAKFAERLRRCCPVVEGSPLKQRTTLRIGGAPALTLEPRTRDELCAALSLLFREGVPWRILGGGSNLLVDDERIPEIVVSTRGLNRIFHFEGDGRRLRAEAGASLARLVSVCRKSSLSGAECLAGIPGTLGGAAVMNAGGRHGSLGRLLRRAVLVDSQGALIEKTIDPAGFGYRASPLKGEVVCEVELCLALGDKDRIWEEMGQVLKEKKTAQPLLSRSCGCVFKNPPNASAGRLLESVGMKGLRSGGAAVSSLHANFILNESGECRFRDYLSLIEEGEKRVMDHYGILLEKEVEIWTSNPAP